MRVVVMIIAIVRVVATTTEHLLLSMLTAFHALFLFILRAVL